MFVGREELMCMDTIVFRASRADDLFYNMYIQLQQRVDPDTKQWLHGNPKVINWSAGSTDSHEDKWMLIYEDVVNPDQYALGLIEFLQFATGKSFVLTKTTVGHNFISIFMTRGTAKMMKEMNAELEKLISDQQ